MEITNPNYNTMPEQVNQNTKDIAVLKNTVKTPATIYNATIEMSQDAGVINQSNIMQQVTNTANAFVLDTVGKLFRIVTVENDQVYVEYCAKITGPQGTPGADGVGIQSITSIAPTQDNGYTVTPVTFTDTNGNQVTLNVRAKNGENAQVDSELSPTSENPVQNKVITNSIVNTNYSFATRVNGIDGTCKYFKIGNCVIVLIEELKFNTQLSHNEIIFSNLPKSSGFVYVNLVGNHDGGGNTLRLNMASNSSDLTVWYETYTPNQSERYYGLLSYLTNE